MDKFDLRKYVANRTLTTTPKKVRRISEAKNSIHKKLSEIENLGRAAALEIKMEAIAEEIEARNTRLGMIDENEDLAELMNPQKIREMKKEIKMFEKQQLKYQKLLEKEQNKDKGKKKVVVDKIDDEVDESLGTVNDPDTPTAHGNVAEAGYDSNYEEDDNDPVNEDFDDVVDDIMDQGKSEEDAKKIAGAINRDYVGNYR